MRITRPKYNCPSDRTRQSLIVHSIHSPLKNLVSNRVDFHAERQVLPADALRKPEVKGHRTLEKTQSL